MTRTLPGRADLALRAGRLRCLDDIATSISGTLWA